MENTLIANIFFSRFVAEKLNKRELTQKMAMVWLAIYDSIKHPSEIKRFSPMTIKAKAFCCERMVNYARIRLRDLGLLSFTKGAGARSPEYQIPDGYQDVATFNARAFQDKASDEIIDILSEIVLLYKQQYNGEEPTAAVVEAHRGGMLAWRQAHKMDTTPGTFDNGDLKRLRYALFKQHDRERVKTLAPHNLEHIRCKPKYIESIWTSIYNQWERPVNEW
jgi:hypothetical protein